MNLFCIVGILLVLAEILKPFSFVPTAVDAPHGAQVTRTSRLSVEAIFGILATLLGTSIAYHSTIGWIVSPALLLANAENADSPAPALAVMFLIAYGAIPAVAIPFCLWKHRRVLWVLFAVAGLLSVCWAWQLLGALVVLRGHYEKGAVVLLVLGCYLLLSALVAALAGLGALEPLLGAWAQRRRWNRAHPPARECDGVTVKFDCRCGRVLQAPVERADEEARCPTCRAVLTIPAYPAPDTNRPSGEPAR